MKTDCVVTPINAPYHTCMRNQTAWQAFDIYGVLAVDRAFEENGPNIFKNFKENAYYCKYG